MAILRAVETGLRAYIDLEKVVEELMIGSIVSQASAVLSRLRFWMASPKLQPNIQVNNHAKPYRSSKNDLSNPEAELLVCHLSPRLEDR